MNSNRNILHTSDSSHKFVERRTVTLPSSISMTKEEMELHKSSYQWAEFLKFWNELTIDCPGLLDLWLANKINEKIQELKKPKYDMTYRKLKQLAGEGKI